MVSIVPIILTFLCIQICLWIIGYVGNILTCIVIISNKSMHTSTNVYLFNLALADTLMLTSGILEFLTETMYAKSDHNIKIMFGKSGCFLEYLLFHISFNVSIMTIISFMIERYIAMCQPFLARRIVSIPKAVKLMLVIWIIGISFAYFTGSETSEPFIDNFNYCAIDVAWEATVPYFQEIELIVFFVLPFVILVILYILIRKQLSESSKIQKNRGRINMPNNTTRQIDSFNRRSFRMLMVVVAAFFIFWAPVHMVNMYLNWMVDIKDDNSPDHIDVRNIVGVSFFFQSTFYFLSSAINPIIYNIMSHKFRTAFKNIFLKCCCPCRKKPVTIPELITAKVTVAETEV